MAFLQAANPLTLEITMFFGLWPEASVRAELATVMRRLKPTLSAAWVRPENLHITLAFLGEVEASRVDAATAAADAVSFEAFELALDRTDYWRKPQVFCLTPSAVPETLEKLAADLAANLQNAGFKLDTRPYRAHLTLARKAARPPENVPLEKAVVWRSSAFVLVESRQDRLGSCYTIIRSWHCRAGFSPPNAA